MSDSRIETTAACVGAEAQLGVQPWNRALPFPVAVGPPHEVHCTRSTDSVPSAVSCSDIGRIARPPRAPEKYTGGGGVVAVVTAGVVVTAVPVVEAGLLVTAGVVWVTVLVAVEPQPARARRKAARIRRLTRAPGQASAGRPIPITFNRRDSAVNANSFISWLEKPRYSYSSPSL
jgi:hypothetical protein